MLSIHRWRISSYLNCLKDYYTDDKVVSTIAFLIASARGDNLEFFAPDDEGVVYTDRLEDVKGECDEYVSLLGNYSGKTIKSTGRKLWYHYANEPVEFTSDERQILLELGIRI
jgi:hypothetical protein